MSILNERLPRPPKVLASYGVLHMGGKTGCPNGVMDSSVTLSSGLLGTHRVLNSEGFEAILEKCQIKPKVLFVRNRKLGSG